MKTSLTTETTSAFFDRRMAMAEVPERTISPVLDRLADGLTLTPWLEALQVWRSALDRLSGATFYHCERWIESLRRAYGFQLEVATFHRRGEMTAAAVFARMKGLFSTRLVSLPFSDCGGPLAIDDESRADFLRALASSSRASSIEIRGIAGPEPWKNVDCFGHWTLDLKRPFLEINAGFSRTIRGGVKRGRQGNV